MFQRDSFTGDPCNYTCYVYVQNNVSLVKCKFLSAEIFYHILLTVNLSSNALDKLEIYRENFEKAYVEATEGFYRTQAAAYLQENGVQNYMKYVCTCVMHHVIYIFSLALL